MNRFEFCHFLLHYLISVLYANGIENQTICQTVYSLDNEIIVCEQYNKTDPRHFDNKEIMKNCTDGDSQTDGNRISLYVERKLRILNNGFCVLRPSFFVFLDFLNIENFSSRSENTVLQNHTFWGLCKLKNIDLSESGIEVVEPEAFACVKSIRKLFLTNNKIESLTKDVFKELQGLRELHLNGNRIRTFLLGTFDNLVSLNTLGLEHNLIDSLPDGLFRQLAHLFQLFIGRNTELKVTADAFEGKDNLYELRMNECNLNKLPPAFMNNTRLVKLNLTRNNFDVLTSDLFSSLKYLTIIYLDSNNITELREPFQYNENLKEITLARNKLSVIEEDDFRGLSLLTDLDLSSNFIEHIEESSFHGLSTLRYLNLSHNIITNLQRTSSFHSILSNLSRIEELDLSDNGIKTLRNAFVNNRHLDLLHINENPLILDKDSFKSLNGLNVLSLQKCNITSLPSDLFKNTPFLCCLNLYGNNLKDITPDTFGQLQYLIEINLTLSNISTLKRRPFKGQRDLEYLRLDINNLSEIKTGDFEGLTSIKFLDISRNCITKIASNSFDDMRYLETLNLDHNLIFSLSGFHYFRKNVNLREINVSHNKLAGIWSMDLEHLVHLQVINASNNRMTEVVISETFPGRKDLMIHLESNKIRHILTSSEPTGGNMEGYKDEKTQIYLQRNRLQCDCKNYALYELLKGRNFLSQVQFVDGLICQSPVEYKEKKISDLKPTDFICNRTKNCPDRCICPYSAHDNTQSVDCSKLDYSNLPSHAPFNTSILYISQNNMTSLLRLSDSSWENLTELYANDNLIESEEFVIPKTLKFLSLRNNKLKILPNTLKKHMERVRDFKIAISNNLWSCDCASLLAFKTWILQHLKQVTDSNEIRCVFPNDSLSRLSLTMMEDSELCPPPTSLFVYLMVVVIALVFTSFLVFYYKYKLYILSFIYTHCFCLYAIFCCDRRIEEDKIFDCFISYGAGDRDVTLAILQELEEKPPNYKFCIHERNWIPGRFITNNILVSVQNSRKTLIVLSESFMKSQWFQLEFQAAYYQTLQDRKDRLIIVLVDDIPEASELEEDLAFVISWKTHLLWGEKWFWEKLRYALYEEKSLTRNQTKCNLENMLCCFLEKTDKIQQNIPMDDDLSSAIRL